MAEYPERLAEASAKMAAVFAARERQGEIAYYWKRLKDELTRLFKRAAT